MKDEILNICPKCKQKTFVVEAEGIGLGKEEHYPIGHCKKCNPQAEGEEIEC